MESWYKKQTDFSEQNLAKIKHWMSNEILEISDIFSFKAAC
jgi:hypothetical protein